MSSSKYKLSSNLTILPGVGPKLKEIFGNINIQNIRYFLDTIKIIEILKIYQIYQ